MSSKFSRRPRIQQPPPVCKSKKKKRIVLPPPPPPSKVEFEIRATFTSLIIDGEALGLNTLFLQTADFPASTYTFSTGDLATTYFIVTLNGTPGGTYDATATWTIAGVGSAQAHFSVIIEATLPINTGLIEADSTIPPGQTATIVLTAPA